MLLTNYNNWWVFKNDANKIVKKRMSDFQELAHIDELNIENIKEIKLRKADMSDVNRVKVDIMLEEIKKTVSYDTHAIQPCDSLDEYYDKVQKYTKKVQRALEMTKEDIATLENLIKKYNKTTIVRKSRVL